MPHRTWIGVLMNFASLVSCFFNCLIDCLTDDFIGWPTDRLIDWLAGVSGADGRDSEDDGLSDDSTGRLWFSGEEDLNDDCSTRDLTDWSTGCSFGGSSRCFKFSVMRGDCLSIDWFSNEGDEEVDCLNNCSFGCSSDCSPGWSSDCSSDCSSGWSSDCSSGCFSSWFCGGRWDNISDDFLLNEFCEVWKNFENRGKIDCRRFACYE